MTSAPALPGALVLFPEEKVARRYAATDAVEGPLFINPGDRIRVDTRVGEYLERAKG